MNDAMNLQNVVKRHYSKQEPFTKAIIWALIFEITYGGLAFFMPPAAQFANYAACTTNPWNITTHFITFTTAPFSAAEIFIIANQEGISHSNVLGEYGIILGNFILVGLLIFLTVWYIEGHSKVLKGLISPSKVIMSALVATYAVGIGAWAYGRCSTGTSIIGFSLASLLLANLLLDRNADLIKGGLKNMTATFMGLLLVGSCFLVYIISGWIHLLGGALFVLILFTLEPKLKRYVRRKYTSIRIKHAPR